MMIFQSEIDFRIVVAALQELFHLLNRRLAGIGAGAGVTDCVDSDVMQSLKEDIFGNEALLGGIAVSTVVADAVGDVQIVVHLTQVCDQSSDLVVIRSILVGNAHVINDNAVAFLCGFILGVEGDNLRQVHGVCGTVDDMCAVIGKRTIPSRALEKAIPARHCALCIRSLAAISPL